MTPLEEAQLQQFLTRLVEASLEHKDPRAEALIVQAFRRQPNAAYLLTQRAMALGVALQAAQQRIRELEESLAQARDEDGRVSTAGQGREASHWGHQGYPPGRLQGSRFAGGAAASAGPAASVGSATPAGLASASGAARPAAQSSWTQGLLGSLVGAAAGVVVGQAIWQGMQSLLAESPTPDLGASGLDASGFSGVDPGFGAADSGFTQVADSGGSWGAAGADEGMGFEGDFSDGDWI